MGSPLPRFLSIALLLAGCGSAEPARREPATAEVKIPDVRATPADSVAPPKGTHAPPPPPDPFDYYVGSWDGVVNHSLHTRLEVASTGHFEVQADAGPAQSACRLTGRMRVEEDVLFLDVEKSSCSVESEGTTLERRVMQKDDDGFVVQSPDWSMHVRYTRRR